MKILLLTQYYPPEGASIPATLAHGLAQKGHDVRVLTGFPNYPTGKVFDGYRQQWRSRETDGPVEVLRVPLYADHSMNALARTANYASFALSSATARSFARDVDVVYVYATQMTPALGPWLWRMLGGAPYVLHVQDLWPDSILGSSIVPDSPVTGVIDSVLNPWLRHTYHRASSVIGIAPTMVETLIERGSPVDRTRLIYNWSEETGTEQLPAHTPCDGQTRFIFAGNIGDMQDLETVVRAAKLVEDSPVRVTIVGDGVALDGIRTLAADLDATNVDFLGRVPQEEMPALYAQAEYALVTLKDLPVFRGTIPSKFQGALAHGLPVVTTVQGDLRSLVEGLGVGYTADAEDPESLAATLVRASELNTEGADDYGRLRERTRDVYVEQFSLSAGIEAVEDVLREAAGVTRLPAR